MSENMTFYNKDIQITRQSQIKMAYEFLTSKKIDFSIVELQRVTDIFTECIIREQDADLKKRMKALDSWILEKQNSANNGK